MGAVERYNIASDEDFQHRVEMILFNRAAAVLDDEPGEQDAIYISAAKRVVNGLIPVAAFCKILVNDETLGPLVDAAASQSAVVDGEILAAMAWAIEVLAAGQI